MKHYQKQDGSIWAFELDDSQDDLITQDMALLSDAELQVLRALSTAPIPSISPRQIRQALTRAGLRASVEAAVAAGDQDLKDWYEFSTAFERVNPQVNAMGAALGVSPEALDDLWALGASL